MKHLLFGAAALCLAAVASPAGAVVARAAGPVAHASAGADAVPVAEGCGWGRWRGPWGGCRGPGPGPGWYPPHVDNGCPPGFWRGPWGHCRDTPFHGRLPGGGWR